MPFGSSRGRNERKRRKNLQDNAVSSKERRNSWSVSDIIVVVGVSGMGGQKRERKKERECYQTYAEESRSHMHHDGDDDTIWSFAPEACDNITATCYVLHGQRHAWELLTPTRKTQPPTRVGRQRLHIRAKVEGWVDGLDGCAYGRLRKRMAAYLEVAGRRALGRIFLYLDLSDLSDFSDDASYPSFLFQTTTSSTRGCPDPLQLLYSPRMHTGHFLINLSEIWE